MQKELRYYETAEGRKPFIEAIASLKDKIVRAHIQNRLDRVAVGNFGDYKSLGEGVYELRIHYGGGYRVYFAEVDKTIVLLLMGGSKQTQKRDVIKAKAYWKRAQERLL